MSFLRSMFPASGTPDRFLLFWKALAQLLPDLPADPPPGQTPPTLPAPTFEEPVYRSLVNLIGAENLATDAETLTRHACGLSYRGFVQRRLGAALPLAVVYPETEAQIASLMLWAAGRELRLRPWGGGSYTPPLAQSEQAYLVLDLSRLHRIQRLDAQSGQITVQAGIRWGALEQALNAQGLTTGLHFPAAESTVGGALSVGAWTPFYLEGGLFARVLAVRGVTPAGPLILTRPAPGEADARTTLLGQAGAWGVITEATLRIAHLPQETLIGDVDVADWDTGINVMRRLLQLDLPLTWARLTPLLEWGLLTPSGSGHGRLSLSNLREQGRLDWIRLNLGWSGRSEINTPIRKEIEHLLKQEFPETSFSFRNGEHREALWPPRWLDELRLWERGLLMTNLQALVPWNRVAPFLRDWERALKSITQARLGASWISSTIHVLFEGALVRTRILAYPAEQDAGLLLSHLDAIEAVAQTIRQRWNVNNPAEKPLRAIRELVADYFDPEGVWMR